MHLTPLSRRRAVAVLALTGVAGVGAGTLGLFGADPSSAGSSALPTAPAEARDLEVSDEEAGTLARADTTTVVYDGTGGRVGGGPAGSGPITSQSAGDATVAAITPTQDCTADPSVCESTTTSTPPQQTVPSLVPDDTAPDDTAPPAEPAPDDRGADLGDGQTAGPTGDVPQGDLGDGALDGSETPTGAPTATLTELLRIGSAAGRGSVLYRADDEPIVVLLAGSDGTPLFRDLSTGSEGPDVAVLEANLIELGYGRSGMRSADQDFDAATAAAVTAWEEALGRAAPDGVVTVGEVVFLDGQTAVLGHEAAVGDLLESGDSVLVLGAESRVVETDVLAEDAADWPVGTAVTLEWGDDTTSTGTVTEVSRDVVDGEVALVITVDPASDQAAAARPIGSRVDVVRTVAHRDGVVAVPVAAVVQGEDGPAVRVVGGGDAPDRVTPVELGIVDGGWVEVTDGIEAGTEVRLPG